MHRIIYLCSRLNIISDMKKIMMTLAAVLCCAMTTAVFTACGGDDSDPTPERKIVRCEINYSLNFPKEKDANTGNLYALCTKIEVAYIDDKGTEQREEVKNGQWSKKVTYTKSVNSYLKLYLTAPESIDIASLTYDRYTTLVNATPDKPSDITFFYNDNTMYSGVLSTLTISSENFEASNKKEKVEALLKTLCEESPTILTINFTM